MMNKLTKIKVKSNIMKQLQTTDLQKLPHNFQVRFALFCAKQVVDLVEPKYKHKQLCDNAILTVEKWLDNKATVEECRTAADAAYAAYAAAHAVAFAVNAAYAAANAAYAAYTAAHAAYTACTAANAADAAAHAAYTVYTAANAAHAAANASHNKEQTIKEQWDYYNELLNFDKNFEEIVLT